MQLRYFFLVTLIAVLSCKSDKSTVQVSQKVVPSETSDSKEDIKKIPQTSKVLTAKLDRLKIRLDSAMNARTAVVIAEGDSLTYLDVFSTQRENLKLRGKYYHEPWLKVLHAKSGKTGWVYAGAVNYAAPELKQQHNAASKVLAQVYADDLEWEGTVPTGWHTATIADGTQFKLFLLKFKDLVAADDIDAIADLIRYPIKEIASAQEFKSNYSRIFTNTLKATVADQRLDRIFRNASGASIGNGDIWFHQVGSAYKIVAINFKGRADITRELMQKFSTQYVADAGDSKKSIKAFTINGFLELNYNYQDLNGYPQSKSLGKYLFETSQNGRHTFVQDTRDSLKRQLIFEAIDSTYQLSIIGDQELNELVFKNF